MRAPFSEDVFDKITQFGSETIKSLIVRTPKYFLVQKFQTLPLDLQEFVNDKLLYCYPTMRSIALKYAIMASVIEKFGKLSIGEFVSDDLASFLKTKGSLLYHEYSVNSDAFVAEKFAKIPIKYKLDNDSLALNVFNLCHRISVPEKCECSDNQLAIRVIDIIFTIHSISYLLSSAEDILNSSSVAPLSSNGVNHLSKGTFQAKQLVFAAIFRIRSGWDKLMFNLLAEAFSVKFSKNDGYFKKLKKLRITLSAHEEYSQSFLYLIGMAESIDSLRNLRDNELHNYGVSVNEMFDSQSLSTRMNQALHESLLLREAVALCFSTIAGHQPTIIARTPYVDVNLDFSNYG